MKYSCFKVWLVCCFNIFLMNCSQAQYSRRFIVAKEGINKLHKGDLLVQLKSERNRLNTLNIELTKGNNRYKRKVQKLLDETTNDRDSFNFYMIQSIKRYYSFSNVFFFYDSDYAELKKTAFSGNKFLDDKLNISVARDSDTRDYFILKQDLTNGQSLESWILTNRENVVMPRPFPSKIRLNTLASYVNTIFYKKEKFQLNSDRYANLLQKKYESFYMRCNK